jgi:hypothetical protein
MQSAHLVKEDVFLRLAEVYNSFSNFPSRNLPRWWNQNFDSFHGRQNFIALGWVRVVISISEYLLGSADIQNRTHCYKNMLWLVLICGKITWIDGGNAGVWKNCAHEHVPVMEDDRVNAVRRYTRTLYDIGKLYINYTTLWQVSWWFLMQNLGFYSSD